MLIYYKQLNPMSLKLIKDKYINLDGGAKKVVRKKTPVKKIVKKNQVVRKKTPVKKIVKKNQVVRKKTPVKKVVKKVVKKNQVVRKKTPVKTPVKKVVKKNQVVRKKTPVKKSIISINDYVNIDNEYNIIIQHDKINNNLLHSLYLNCYLIRDITPLSGLTNLTDLDLDWS